MLESVAVPGDAGGEVAFALATGIALGDWAGNGGVDSPVVGEGDGLPGGVVEGGGLGVGGVGLGEAPVGVEGVDLAGLGWADCGGGGEGKEEGCG